MLLFSIHNFLKYLEYRKIRRDHTFSYGNKFYLIKFSLKKSISKQEIEIRTKDKAAGFKAFFSGRELEIAEVVEPSKYPIYDGKVNKKTEVLELADSLQNISEAARVSGTSRQAIYNYKKQLLEKGPQGLKRASTQKHHHKSRFSTEIETSIIEFSLANPHLGQNQVALSIREKLKIEISPGGIRNIWLRFDMQTTALRIKKQTDTALPLAA